MLSGNWYWKLLYHQSHITLHFSKLPRFPMTIKKSLHFRSDRCFFIHAIACLLNAYWACLLPSHIPLYHVSISPRFANERKTITAILPSYWAHIQFHVRSPLTSSGDQRTKSKSQLQKEKKHSIFPSFFIVCTQQSSSFSTNHQRWWKELLWRTNKNKKLTWLQVR